MQGCSQTAGSLALLFQRHVQFILVWICAHSTCMPQPRCTPRGSSACRDVLREAGVPDEPLDSWEWRKVRDAVDAAWSVTRSSSSLSTAEQAEPKCTIVRLQHSILMATELVLTPLLCVSLHPAEAGGSEEGRCRRRWSQ